MKKLTTLLLLSALVHAPAYSMEEYSEEYSDPSRTESGPEVLYRLTVEKDANGIPKITPTVIKDGVVTEIPYKPEYCDTISDATDGTTLSLKPNDSAKLYPGTDKYVHLSPCGRFLLYSDHYISIYNFSDAYLCDLSSGKKFKFKQWFNIYRCLAGKFSPDGKRLLLFQPSFLRSDLRVTKLYDIEQFPPKKLKRIWGQNPRWSEDSALFLTEEPGAFSIHTKDGKRVLKKKCNSTVQSVEWFFDNSVQVADLDEESRIALKNIRKTTKPGAERNFLLREAEQNLECTVISVPDKKRSLIKRLQCCK